MEKLFEKILHEMRSGIAFVLASGCSLFISIVNPIGVFQLIFEFVFQYTQNKIFSFSFSSILLFFYAIFNKAFLWCEAKKYEQDLIDQKDKEIALKIHKCHNEIKKNFINVILKNKIKSLGQMNLIIG